MKTIAKPLFTPLTTQEIRPSGWLRRQLEIEADGLAGNLDKVWPDVRDSAWIGGSREGWERVPYWLDGFIPLAWLLDDADRKARAKKYVDAILDRQQPDGWICPCTDEGRAKYDTWAVLLISKVLMLYFDCTGDERAATAVRRALKQLSGHLDEHPLFDWGKRRWYEGLIAICRLYELRPEEWLVELARKLHAQGFDYEELMIQQGWKTYKTPQHEWLWDAHVVNYAMALKYPLLYSLTDDAGHTDFGTTMLQMLQQYHGMATGHFTGDEILSGTSPVQGSELCGVVEAMYSSEINFAVSGAVAWADHCERLACNMLPAACTPDMWAHQYDQQTNQIGCLFEEKLIWSTNAGDANRYGLEPHYGCCTANFGQGWPKFALSTFMKSKTGLVSAILAPSAVETTVNGTPVRIELATRYPFGGRLVYTVTAERPVRFTFDVRIPGFAARAKVDGQSVPTGALHTIEREWSGTSTVVVELEFDVQLKRRPSGLFFAERGPLLFSLPIPYRQTKVEYEKDGVERKFPYCDYETEAAGAWNFGFASGNFTAEEREIGLYPFAQETPPLLLHAVMKELPWPVKEGFKGVAEEQPGTPDPAAPVVEKELIPYGCTMLRMTEMPKLF